MNLTFHQSVKTPNGPGIVQGINADQSQVLISHRYQDIPADMRPARPGLWVLRWYQLNQIEVQ